MNQMTAMDISFFCYRSDKIINWKRNGTEKRNGTGKIAYPPAEKNEIGSLSCILNTNQFKMDQSLYFETRNAETSR